MASQAFLLPENLIFSPRSVSDTLGSLMRRLLALATGATAANLTLTLRPT